MSETYLAPEPEVTPEMLRQGALEAEQALLGCALYDNAAYDLSAALVLPDQFCEPVHGRMWAAIGELIGKGRLAEPIVLLERFRGDPAFEEMGGLHYLGDLIDRAPPAANGPDYAKVIADASTRRRLVNLGHRLVAGADARRDISVVEMIDMTETALLKIGAGGGDQIKVIGASQAIDEMFDYIDAPPELRTGVLTGLAPIDDDLLGPLMPSDLIAIAGRPSMGKSALAACIATNIASKTTVAAPKGYGVLEINSEMTTAQMMRRHATDYAFTRFGRAAPSYSDIRKRKITAEQRQMLVEVAPLIRALPLKMVKRTGLTLARLRTLIRRQAMEWARQGIPLGAVIIDHVGHLKGDGTTHSRYEEQTQISEGLKTLADDIGAPIIALIQLSRKVEERDDKRPILSDLRDSGSWEQDADAVVGIYRDAYYAQRQREPKGDNERTLWNERKADRWIEALGLKVREGEAGMVKLWGDMRTNAIRGDLPSIFYDTWVAEK